MHVLATSAAGLQQLEDAAGRKLAPVAMVITNDHDSSAPLGPRLLCAASAWQFLGLTNAPSKGQLYRMCLR